MGTSSIYTGPSGNPLLPDDFDDNQNSESQHDGNSPDQENSNADGESTNDNQNNNNDENRGGDQEANSSESNWSNAKNFMSRYASGASINYKRAVSSYVKAHGGSKSAAKSASSGIRSTSGFGQFLSTSSTQGIRETLSQYNIEYEGRTAKEILTEVLNRIAPVPVTKEDSVARKALLRSMEELYEKLDDENNDISTLEKIDKGLLNEMIPIQVESYIYERIINDLGSRIESKSTSPADAISKEKELKEYINSKVETTLNGKDFSLIDFNNTMNKEVESLYVQCYKVMEDLL
ncbi:hypothetical protein SAMN05444285_105117 [Draconibacterium orientale]|uniref:Uncharacterized protein n=1 Tax=Draconibacterium orientale TaxID=1168034 RepID=X5E664_9BACT|nr:Qat anti-phage system associated protein QatB [Draconibacterium orientale]AHW62141.1 hypothetical protein FH5T_16005 [Draconibacterium orientale]SET06556.1 hypothetical protein SAMN05444285_105117 [Draconibacterium orientale]